MGLSDLKTPNGKEEIIRLFGDPTSYELDQGQRVKDDWPNSILTPVYLVSPLPLSWNMAQKVKRISINKQLAADFSHLLGELESAHLWEKITSFGGCYCWRAQVGGDRLSTHSWGIALDLNVETNQRGTPGNMDKDLVAVFNDFGWLWGGIWPGQRCDPMHFQKATGY